MKRLSFIRNDEAQSTVEFALILPVLLLILLGIVEFGWLFSSRIIITSAAREGARVYAITKDADLAREAVIDSSAFVSITEDEINTDILPLNTTGDIIQMATIEINTYVEPIIRLIVRDAINMRAVASMRLESLD